MSEPTVTHDITETLPIAVAARTIASSYAAAGSGVADVLIGGLPFRYALSDQNPYVRQTAEFKRQQIDTSPEPGEQTLSSWWTRDQTSWHRGAGVNFYEPGSEPSTRYRFTRSMGVDVWTRGEASLLKRMEVLNATGPGQSTFLCSALVNNQEVLFVNAAGVMYRVDTDGVATEITCPSAPIGEPCVAGGKLLVGSAAGILSGTLGGSSMDVLWGTSSNRNPRVWFVKARIIAAMGPSLYDLTFAGGTIDSGPATPLWTHPSSTWHWTGVSETPNAILAAGYEAGRGGIFKFVLEQPTSGSIPTLSAGIPVADMPPGEEVHALRTFLGSNLAIGTSRGLRLGEVDQSGDLQFGPLTIETSKPVRALAARDRFMYAGIENDLDGSSGVARVDLSEEIDNQAPTVSGVSQAAYGYRRTYRFAWAYDANTHLVGQVDSVAFLGSGGRVAVGLFGVGCMVQHPYELEPEGYVLSGKVRFGTAELKRFMYARMRADIPNGGSVALSTVDDGGSEVFCFSLGDVYNTGDDIALASVSESLQSHAAFRLTLRKGATVGTGPVLSAFQVKALPVIRVQRDVRVPLWLADKEKDRAGNPLGYVGAAWQRLQVLERMESTQAIVSFEDKTNGERFSAVITQVQFTRDTNPSRVDMNFGGRLNVTLRRL